ncbi:MAG: hypothetical protein ACNS60_05460 [Candidatus Cyclobacteriaceae bacterium M2_1C_046]
MKSFVLKILLILILPAFTYAQTQKGAMLTNGSISFSFNDVKQEVNNDNRDIGSLTTINFNPSFGYFVINGVAAGAGIEWQRSAFKDTDNDRFITHSFSLTPFARYYSELGPFFHGQFSIGGGKNMLRPDGGPTRDVSDFSLFGVAIGLGYPYFLQDHISIEPMILFRAENNKTEEQNIFGSVEETVKHRGLLIQIGFTYYIF